MLEINWSDFFLRAESLVEKWKFLCMYVCTQKIVIFYVSVLREKWHERFLEEIASRDQFAPVSTTDLSFVYNSIVQAVSHVVWNIAEVSHDCRSCKSFCGTELSQFQLSATATSVLHLSQSQRSKSTFRICCYVQTIVTIVDAHLATLLRHVTNFLVMLLLATCDTTYAQYKYVQYGHWASLM